MTSFQITLTPSKRAAARFVAEVRRALQKALAEESQQGLTQSDIARAVNVNRSVIHRQIRGYQDMSIGRVAEIASAMGRTPHFELQESQQRTGANTISRVSVSSSGTFRFGEAQDITKAA